MSELLVIAFDTQEKAEAMRSRFLEMQKSYLVSVEDAVVAVKRDDGSIVLHQLVNLTTAGAVAGGFWGTLIGALFLNPLVGAAIGAAGGALSGALADIGINDSFIHEVSNVLQPGTAALFVLVRKMTADKVLDELSGMGGTVLRTSLDRTHEQALRDALQGAVRAHAELSTAASRPV
jgi:uncharacterized membrane protein